MRRDLARWFGRRLCNVAPAEPIISFTFDDFPRTALIEGGGVLRSHGVRGTYYASFGLMGKKTPTGEIFSEADFDEWARQGHELGCHTFDHCDAWETIPAEFEASILRNRRAAVALLTGASVPTLSYPISSPRPETKRRAGKHFTGCRGGGQTFNAGTTDLNLLKAFFLEQQREDLSAIQRMIDETVRRRGWLILATHDVCDAPTRFGCTPAWLKQVVGAALASGAAVLPVGHALESIQGAADRGSNADRISG